MTMTTPNVGDYVQGMLGHYFRVLEVLGGGWRFRVECLTPVDPPGTLVPIGAPVVVGRSELRLTERS